MSSNLDRHLERFRAHPTDRRAFEALEEGYFVAGNWRGLASLYEHRLTAIDLASDPSERARVLFRLGQLHAERRQDDERAADCFRQAVAADPQYRPPLTELRRLHAERSQWEVALQIAEAEVGLEMTAGERAELLGQSGRIWLEHLLEPEVAIEQFQRALENDPGHALALEGAARASHELGRPGDAARFWERCAASSTGPARARALVSQGGLLAGVLGARERAAEVYEAALAVEPDNTQAVAALTALAEAAEDWPRLATLQERRFELCREPEGRAAIALAAGRLHLDQLSDPEAARRWLTRAAELEDGDPAVYRAFAQLERECGDDAQLRRALEQLVERSGERVPVDTLLELASLHSDSGNEERALDLLNGALARAPEDVLVVEALCDTLVRLGRPEALVDCLERRAALCATDPTSCATVLAELGELHEQQLDDPESARQAYERAMMADPTTPGVSAALERIYGKVEAWDALRGLLDQVSRSGPAEERTRALCALGTLLTERFEEPEATARAFDAALAIDPSCPAAHRGRQRLARESGDLQRILEAFESEAATASDPSRLAPLVQELARLHEQRGDSQSALEWTRRWIAATPEDSAPLRVAARLQEELGLDEEMLETLQRLDPLLQAHAQAENRRRIAAHHVRSGRPEEAIASLRAALDVDPGDVESLRSLDVIFEEAGRHPELAAVRRRLSELVPAPERAAYLDALAILLQQQLDDLPGAIDALIELVDCENAPADADERLAALLDLSARHEELAVRLEERARRLPPEDEATRELVLRRSRVLLEHLSRFDEAAAGYRQVLALHPDCPDAREGLERSLRAAGDSAGLAALLAERMSEDPDPIARDRYALERAVILEEVLDDTPGAVEIYQHLCVSAQAVDARVRASQRLEVLLERAQAWPELRSHLERVLETVEGKERGPLLEGLGRLCRDRLDDSDAALQHFEELAQLEPGRSESWQALAQLYEAAGCPLDLARVLEKDLENPTDAERELNLRRHLASVYLDALADADRAAVHLERILELDPGDSRAGEFLIQRFEEQQRPDEVARVLERRLEALDAMPRDGAGDWEAQRASLRLRIAGLRAGPLDDPDGAIAALEPALGEIGAKPLVAEPLADLYRRTGYLDELIGLCQRVVGECAPGAERAGWFARLGRALGERGSKSSRAEAAEAWRQVLAERPDDDTARTALRDLYRYLDEPEPLARLLEAELESLAGPPEVPVRMELAGLCAGPLRRPADALGHLRRVVHVDPSHAAARTRALELAEELERGEVVLELLDGALARAQGASRRASLLTRRARVLATLPERVDEAVDAYREALRLDGSRTDVRETLRGLLAATGRHEEVLDCLLVEAARSAPAERARVYEEAADLAWQQLSPEGALPWLERLRRERPRQATVVERIAEVYRLAGRPADRLRALERQLPLAPDAISKRDLHLERARVLDAELGAPGRAVLSLEEAHRLCPEDTEVLERLEGLLRRLGRHRERASVLELLIEISPGRDRVSLLCEAANLRSGPLAEPARGAALLQTAIAETPPASPLRVELLRTLGVALRAADDPHAWARCAETELAALDPAVPVFDERRFELHRELALAYEKLGGIDASLHHLRCVIDAAPDGFDPTGSLEEALLRGLRAQGNSVELERRLAAWLERQPDDVVGWLELARLRDEKLRATSAAAEAYRRVLATDPDALEAIRGLRVAAERLGDWETVADMLGREAECDASLNAESRAGLLRRLGDVAWKKLGSTTRASRTYAAALEANPEDFEAHRSFEQLLEAVEDWRGALDLYESEVAVLGERQPDRRRTAWLRAGEIARDHTDEPERAQRAYVSAAAISPLDLERSRERAELHLVCGRLDAFAEVFAAWCDDPASGAGAQEQLRLADVLEQLGRRDDALARVDRALDLDPSRAATWDAAARLREAGGDATGAAEALARAAELATDGDASGRLLRAAELRAGAGGHEASAELLRSAVALDPGRALAQAELALAALQLDELEEAEEAAARALELDDGGGEALEGERRLAVALAGARAARGRQRIESAADFYARALAAEPGHAQALAGAGECLAELGDFDGAREALTARLALEVANPERARHHALLARCLAEQDPDAALVHCGAALAEDPAEPDAHALRADLLEAAGRADEGVETLERWADAAAPGQRGYILERAAQWELAEEGRRDSAERHLREALADEPGRASAWLLLARLLRDQGRTEEVLSATEHGLDGAEAPELRHQLALLRAEAFEQSGDRTRAAEAYTVAAEADPGSFEAATSQARLLRAIGEWRGAAGALEHFVAGHPGGDAEAEACMQLGRLRAGPLEDLEGAISAYRRAVDLRPHDLGLRTTLADLLGHRPDDQREALAHHREALERDPVHLPSLRACLRAALERGDGDAAGNGLVLLRALGVATPEEAELAPERLSVSLAAGECLDDPLSETLRRAVQKVSREIGAALDAPAAPAAGAAKGAPEGANAVATFCAAALEAEAALTAPGLLPLPTEELGNLLVSIAALALETDELPGSGSTLNAVSAALGRRARRRVRRILEERRLDEIRAIDFAEWRREVRVLAAACAVDTTGCDLRSALLALVCEHSDRGADEIADTADLTPLVAACPEAASLLRRAVRAWLGEA